jgi:hypothetical protein
MCCRNFSDISWNTFPSLLERVRDLYRSQRTDQESSSGRQKQSGYDHLTVPILSRPISRTYITSEKVYRNWVPNLELCLKCKRIIEIWIIVHSSSVFSICHWGCNYCNIKIFCDVLYTNCFLMLCLSPYIKYMKWKHALQTIAIFQNVWSDLRAKKGFQLKVT